MIVQVSWSWSPTFKLTGVNVFSNKTVPEPGATLFAIPASWTLEVPAVAAVQV